MYFSKLRTFLSFRWLVTPCIQGIRCLKKRSDLPLWPCRVMWYRKMTLFIQNWLESLYAPQLSLYLGSQKIDLVFFYVVLSLISMKREYERFQNLFTYYWLFFILWIVESFFRSCSNVSVIHFFIGLRKLCAIVFR